MSECKTCRIIEFRTAAAAPTVRKWLAPRARSSTVEQGTFNPIALKRGADVWHEDVREETWDAVSRWCRLHRPIHSGDGRSYLLCDHLAWVGSKLLNQTYELKDIWPEPGVWSSWFESGRSRH